MWHRVAVLLFAMTGAAAYSAFYSHAFGSPQALLYDLPVNFLAFRYYGDLLFGPPGRRRGVRWILALPAIALSLLRATLHLPLHGHQTTALILGLTESGDRSNPRWGRVLALTPAIIVYAINVTAERQWLHPETFNALLLGGIIGAIGCRLANRSKPVRSES